MLAKFIFYAKTRDPFEKRFRGLHSHLVINLNDVFFTGFHMCTDPAGKE